MSELLSILPTDDISRPLNKVELDILELLFPEKSTKIIHEVIDDHDNMKKHKLYSFLIISVIILQCILLTYKLLSTSISFFVKLPELHFFIIVTCISITLLSCMLFLLKQ